MTKQEWLTIVKVLRATYQREKFLSDKDSLEVWYMLLKDIPCEELQARVMEYITNNKFPPTIADLREVKVEEDDWSKGWEEIQLAIRKFGAWRKDEALDSLSPRTRLIAERFGWEDFCYTENPDVLKAQFRDAFNDNLKREQREIRIPAEFRIGKEDVKAIQD